MQGGTPLSGAAKGPFGHPPGPPSHPTPVGGGVGLAAGGTPQQSASFRPPSATGAGGQVVAGTPLQGPRSNAPFSQGAQSSETYRAAPPQNVGTPLTGSQTSLSQASPYRPAVGTQGSGLPSGLPATQPSQVAQASPATPYRPANAPTGTPLQGVSTSLSATYSSMQSGQASPATPYKPATYAGQAGTPLSSMGTPMPGSQIQQAGGSQQPLGQQAGQQQAQGPYRPAPSPAPAHADVAQGRMPAVTPLGQQPMSGQPSHASPGQGVQSRDDAALGAMLGSS